MAVFRRLVLSTTSTTSTTRDPDCHPGRLAQRADPGPIYPSTPSDGSRLSLRSAGMTIPKKAGVKVVPRAKDCGGECRTPHTCTQKHVDAGRAAGWNMWKAN